MQLGIDIAFNPHPPVSALVPAGVHFVARYMSPLAVNDTNGKNLMPAEARALLSAGLAVVLVEESAADRMLGGHAAGVADAQHGDAVSKALGMGGIPVYFACDFDATPAQQVPVNDYLDGAASVIGVKRVGIYSGYYPGKRALDAGKATWLWQTTAWSGGQWDSRAHIRQQGEITVGNVRVDVDEAMASDYGQWPRPASPPPVQPPPAYPVPASLSATPHPSVNLGWPAGVPQSPHWRVQVALDAGGKPGATLPTGSIVTQVPNVEGFVIPAPGTYWYRVQAAGNSPWSAWKKFTA